MIPSRKSKAVGLFSGGLDSILAAKLVSEQGVSVVALHFRMPFAVPGRIPDEEKLSKLAALAGASLVAVDVGDDYLKIISEPQHGYARQLAPCVDCILYMLAKARELAREIKADFVFTGEVVGQRAVSQNKRGLKAIEKASGMEGRLLRPLSAKLLEPTIPELTGLVRRERLLDFKGRSRRRQIRLAHEYGIFDYPIPGTGCMLLDKNYAARARDAVAHSQLSASDIESLRYGRHFRLDSGAKVIVGRNERENAQIQALVQPDDLLLKPVDVMGPITLLRSQKKTKKDTETAARITARYSDGIEGKSVKIDAGGKELSVRPYAESEVEAWRIKPAERDAADDMPDEPAAKPEAKP
jgi:tRNA-specific 2-thiouridylase